MKKLFESTWLLICSGILVVFMVMCFVNNKPIEIDMPSFTREELAAKKQEAAKEARAVQRKNKMVKMYSCQTDEDCIIVDKDPCGCTIGPKGVTAINVAYLADFDELNNTPFGTKTCPEKASTEKECSLSARAVCEAKHCKITY